MENYNYLKPYMYNQLTCRVDADDGVPFNPGRYIFNRPSGNVGVSMSPAEIACSGTHVNAAPCQRNAQC